MFNAKAAPPSRLSLEPQFVIRSWHELRAKQLQWMLYIHHKHLQYQQRKKSSADKSRNSLVGYPNAVRCSKIATLLKIQRSGCTNSQPDDYPNS